MCYTSVMGIDAEAELERGHDDWGRLHTRFRICRDIMGSSRVAGYGFRRVGEIEV